MSTQDERIAALEERVAALERVLDRARERIRTREEPQGRMESRGPAGRAAPEGAWSPQETTSRLVEFVAGEGALARVGMSLLLIGLAFLVKYGLDEGWINETVRVILAALAGGVLIGLGLKLRGGGRVLSQVLLGGGIGALYIAVFSAYEFYALIPFALAIGLMTLVTALCFVLSVREQSVTLAGVAAAAGLSTPFILHGPEASVPGLAAYIILIQGGVAAVFWIRQWRSTLLVSSVLTLLALVLGLVMLKTDGGVTTAKLALQAAVLAAYLVYGILPLMRLDQGERGVVSALTAGMVALVPLAVWGLSVGVWDLDLWAAAVVAATMAGGYGWAWSREPLPALLFGAASLASAALLTATDGHGVGLVALVALALQYLAREDNHGFKGALARLWIFAVGCGLLLVLGEQLSSDTHRWDNMAFDAVGLAALALTGRWSSIQRITHLGVWVLALMYLQKEFGWAGEMVSTGPALVTISWALLGLALLAAGRRTRCDDYRFGGMATIGLVVGKLLLHDLNELDPVWRILIFLGIGAALLGMSYAFPAWWRLESEPEPEAGPDPNARPQPEPDVPGPARD